MQTGFLGRNLHGSQMDSFFYSPHEAACAAASSLAASHRLRVGSAPEPGGTDPRTCPLIGLGSGQACANSCWKTNKLRALM
jgi:hypothetical protein